MASPVFLGLDFGTESVRALLVDAKGNEIGLATNPFPHGQIIDHLPGSKQPLPPLSAFQNPSDWLSSAAKATRAALRKANIEGDAVVGIGVDDVANQIGWNTSLLARRVRIRPIRLAKVMEAPRRAEANRSHQ
jgi:ribulose kinase